MEKENKTKRKILNLLKSHGTLSQMQLSEKLNVTKMAISRQLNILVSENLVQKMVEKKGIGRPTMKWSLTDSASEYFPDSHSELSVSLLKSIKKACGEEKFKEVLNLRVEEQLDLYREKIEENCTIEKKLELLCDIRQDEGYMSEWRKISDNEYEFLENHCPICTAAVNCVDLCKSEAYVFQTILGDSVEINREEHIANGEHRCLYKLKL